LPHPLTVAISLVDLPAARDTVQLFMGPPREFVLDIVPCGSHRLKVSVPRDEPFRVATPDDQLLFTCERVPFKAMRVVLIHR
jgi:hypothetical protein